jgi:hypothetical protein
MPVFNAATNTAMADRWKLETHSFHLPCGEMKVALENMAMILGLLIRGQPIIDRCDSSGWHDRVAAFLGRELPTMVLGVEGHEVGVCVTWLHEEFTHCPLDADEATMSRYARAWVCHIFATVLFPDSTSDAASWMHIPYLAE